MHADVIKAQVELDKLRDRLRTLQDVKNPTLARLNAALNRPADAPLPFPTNLPARTTSRRNRLNSFTRLKASNPELKSLDFLAERKKPTWRLAKKEFYPDVTLGLDYVETGAGPAVWRGGQRQRPGDRRLLGQHSAVVGKISRRGARR